MRIRRAPAKHFNPLSPAYSRTAATGGVDDDGAAPPFDPEWTYAERVIAATVPLGEDYFDVPPVSPTSAIGAATPPQPLYLVKWAGLPYSDCTWEVGLDVGDDDAIRAFRVRESLPDDVSLMAAWCSRARAPETTSTPPLWAHLCPVVPRLPPPPPSAFSKITVSPTYGVAAVATATATTTETAAPTVATTVAATSTSGATVIHVDTTTMDDEAGDAVSPTASSSNGAVATTAASPSPVHDIQAAAAEPAGLQLHNYQLEGLNWLLWNFNAGRGSILADEMGLVRCECFAIPSSTCGRIT